VAAIDSESHAIDTIEILQHRAARSLQNEQKKGAA